jgi:pSer/pThr/pTyr-binding forkhead associated (FHA) protein
VSYNDTDRARVAPAEETSPVVSFCLVSSLFTPPVRILRRGRVYVCGRDPGCDFPLPSEIVSRRHAEIEWAPRGGFAIRDLGSKNGTLVNGERVDWLPLKDGDKIVIGPFNMQYREYAGDISDLLNQTSPDADQTVVMSRDSFAAPAGFAGQFGGHELLEIVQLIGLNEKEGTLHVTAGGRTGKIYFEKGHIVEARIGDLSGEDAAFEILTVPSGRFEFLGGKVPHGGKKFNTAHIIMEAARRRDEAVDTGSLPAIKTTDITKRVGE